MFNEKELIKKLLELKTTLRVLKPHGIKMEKKYNKKEKKDEIHYTCTYIFDFDIWNKVLLSNNYFDDPFRPISVFNHNSVIAEIVKEISFLGFKNKKGERRK
jgi:hypothetical protein